MCDPATMMIAATAVQAMGQLQSGLYASQVAKNQAKVAEQNKQMARERAEDAIGLGQEDQRKLGREVAARVGAQTARMGANNVDTSYGSAARVTEDTRMIGREDMAALASNTQRQVRAMQTDIWNYEVQKRAAKSEAKQAVVGAVFGAASTALGGATQYQKFRAGRG
jgi:hypothetical protein